MALQEFAAEHTLARLAIDQGGGIETIWQPEPPTMRFGDIAVEVPPFAFLQATSAGQAVLVGAVTRAVGAAGGSEEHTSELQSLMRISYAVFCLKKKTHKYQTRELQ